MIIPEARYEPASFATVTTAYPVEDPEPGRSGGTETTTAEAIFAGQSPAGSLRLSASGAVHPQGLALQQP